MNVDYTHHMFITSDAEDLYKKKHPEFNWHREAFHYKRSEKDELVVRLSYGKSYTIYLVARRK